MSKAAPLLGKNGEELPAGWERCFRAVEVAGEVRYAPTLPLHIVMMVLCMINTFSGTFLVPHCRHLSEFLGHGKTFAALMVCSPYLTNICAIYMSKLLVPKVGWLVATLTNVSFVMMGTLICFCNIYFEGLRSDWLLLAGGLVYGCGMGFQYIGRQLGVVTSSTTTRNSIFAQQTVATSVGILSGSLTSGLTSALAPEGDEVLDGPTLALPFAVLFCLVGALGVFVIVYLPNRVVEVPATSGPVASKPDGTAEMSDFEKKARIWSTLAIGFNRVVVRSMVEMETTAYYQKQCGHTELESSIGLATSYAIGILALEIFGRVHDRLTDRDWIYVTLTFILVGTLMQFPMGEHCGVLDTTKFSLGICLVLPGLAMNTAVANSTATKYAIPTQCLYTQDVIAMLQVITQSTLGRLAGPIFGYVLAVNSMWLTLVLQCGTVLLSFVLVHLTIGSNAAETAKGRAALKEGGGRA